MKTISFVAVAVALLLGACSSGGGDGGSGSAFCQSINSSRSNTTGSCTGCTIADAPAVSDGSLYAFADVELTAANSTASITAGVASVGGASFPAGSKAGAFISTSLPNVVANSVTLQTSSGETAAATVLQSEATRGGTDADRYLYFTTTQPFQSLTITFEVSGNTTPAESDVRVYELCADGHV